MLRAVAAAAALTSALYAAEALEFPKPIGAVSDFAGVLDASTRTSLSALSDAVQRETTSQIAVATVTTLDGMSVEEYANRLFKEWEVGQKGRDNGVLVLVAPAAQTMRIEVGYGLEGVLPDGFVGSIMRETMVPRFQVGDYQGGIVAGVERIAGIVRKEAPRAGRPGGASPSLRPAPAILRLLAMTAPVIALAGLAGFVLVRRWRALRHGRDGTRNTWN